MPHIIPRQQAIDKINNTLKQGECLACWILKSNAKYILHSGKFTTVVLSEYPRTWGQTMILLNEHKISISDTTKDEWDELTENVKKTTATIENVLRPLRCYVASLGATENLQNTCPHLHFNVIPIYNTNDKPQDIFTWRNGVYNANELEWENLFNKLNQTWGQVSIDTR